MNENTKKYLFFITLALLTLFAIWIIKQPPQKPYEIKTSAGTKMMIIPPGWSGHYILDGDNKLYVNPTDLEG